jgi:hypothetical protein
MTAPARTEQRLRLPAFARQLVEARERGLSPVRGWNGAQVLVVLDDWKIAEKRYRLVVPSEDDPEDFDFRVVAALDVILVYNSRRTDGERLKAAIRAILRGAPAALQVFDVFAPHLTWLVKSRLLGIERKEYA